jgi:hypothetical protein
MDDEPATLTLSIAAFRAIAAAVTEAEIGDGPDRRRQTWIVAGDGRTVAHLEDPDGED